MRQYEEMKKKYPDAVLIFRVGDFYETFSEVINKIYIFEEIRVKRHELMNLAVRLGISPRRAFEECYEIKPASLFDL